MTGLRAIAASEGLIMSAEVTGKYKKALQVIAIVLLLLEGTVVEAIGNLHLAASSPCISSLILACVGRTVCLEFLASGPGTQRSIVARAAHAGNRRSGR